MAYVGYTGCVRGLPANVQRTLGRIVRSLCGAAYECAETKCIVGHVRHDHRPEPPRQDEVSREEESKGQYAHDGMHALVPMHQYAKCDTYGDRRPHACGSLDRRDSIPEKQYLFEYGID